MTKVTCILISIVLVQSEKILDFELFAQDPIERRDSKKYICVHSLGLCLVSKITTEI